MHTITSKNKNRKNANDEKGTPKVITVLVSCFESFSVAEILRPVKKAINSGRLFERRLQKKGTKLSIKINFNEHEIFKVKK